MGKEARSQGVRQVSSVLQEVLVKEIGAAEERARAHGARGDAALTERVKRGRQEEEHWHRVSESE